jgi:hypothetical protein
VRSSLLFKIFLLIILLSAVSRTFAETTFPLSPFADYSKGFVNTGNDKLEVGVKIEMKEDNAVSRNFNNFKLSLKFPSMKDDKNTAQIDANVKSTSFKFGSELYLYEDVTDSSFVYLFALEPSIELGSANYKYYNDSVKINPQETNKSHIGLEITGKYLIIDNNTSMQWCFMGRLRYATSIKESEDKYYLQPGSNLVEKMKISEPIENQFFSPAIGINYFPGCKLPVSFAPKLYYYFINDNKSNDFNKEKLRTEFWLYFYPLDKVNLGVRFGIGGFIDNYQKGEDGSKKNTSGLLVNLKMDTNIFTSLF